MEPDEALTEYRNRVLVDAQTITQLGNIILEDINDILSELIGIPFCPFNCRF